MPSLLLVESTKTRYTALKFFHLDLERSVKQGNLRQFFAADFLICKKHTCKPQNFYLYPQT